jgi:AbrB family looped-hinge helix DNA binding protein
METVTVSPKYQVVIPKRIRDDMDLRSGEKIVVFEKNGVIHMVRVGDIKKLKGKYKGLSTDDLRDEHERFT